MLGDGWGPEMKKYMFVVLESCMAAVTSTGFERLSAIVNLADLTYYKVAHYESKQYFFCCLLIILTNREYKKLNWIWPSP